jgi:hypothetical protein
VTGCASHRNQGHQTALEASDDIPEAVVAAALVFDPPMAEYSAAVPSRQGREPVALIGYDSVISTYFYVRTDDRQRFFSDDGVGRYDRRAVSERVGVSQR